MNSTVMGLPNVDLDGFAEQSEIEDERVHGVTPERPKPLRTQKGWKLFPRVKPRLWSVGSQIGKRLRAVDESPEPSVSTGRKNKAHVRRGHWHGVWTGSRSGTQKFKYNWIPPLVAGGHE
jgi:hypothetical protein